MLDRKEIEYLHYLVDNKNETWQEITNKMTYKFNKTFNVNSLKSYVNYRKREGKWENNSSKEMQDIEVKESYNDEGITTQVDFNAKMSFLNKKSKTPRDVLIYKGFSPDSWVITSTTSNEWITESKEGNLFNYQLKFTAKPKTGYDSKDVVEQLLKDVPKMELKQKIHGKRNLVIPLSDLHFPILTLDKAQEYLTDVVELIQKGYNTIVLESLGDIFHSNAMKSSQTIKGTQLEDVDMVSAIEYAKKFFGLIIEVALQYSNEVRIEFAEGNHSAMEYMFLTYLEARYPQAKVNKHNKARIAYKLGNVGIMLTHGHMGKKKDYPMLFATEFKDVWASSSWLECHQGHYHTMEAQNVNGVIHRQLGTIKPNDSYEEENGFTMNYKSTQAFEYSDDKLKTIYELG